MSGNIGGAGSKSGTIGRTELDYEEGTWTPVCGTVGFGYQDGTYAKVGNLVHVSMYGQWNASGTPGTITGLPFTISNRSCMGVVSLNKVNTITVAPFAYCTGTQTYFYIWSVHDDTFWGDAISSVVSGDEVQMTVTYQAA